MTRSIHRFIAPFLCAALLLGGTLVQLAVSANPAAAATPITGFSLTSNNLSSAVGQTVSLNVLIQGSGATPTGTVQILDGASTICTGDLKVSGAFATMSCDVSSLTLGSLSITATYSGDVTYNPDVSTTFVPALNQTVAQASTTTTAALSGTPDPTVVSQPVVINASIAVTAPGAGAPSGTVAFHSDGVDITGCATQPVTTGAASCTTTGLAWGGQSLTATYSGDADFATSSSTGFMHTVAQAATTTVVTSSDTSTNWLDPVTYTATVSPTAPATIAPSAGTVRFQVNGTNITGCTAQTVTSGVATCATTSEPIGTALITAVYSGVPSYSTSTAPAITQTVSKAATVTALASNHNPSRSGQAVTLTATVTSTADTPTGTVLFFQVERDSSHTLLGSSPTTAGVASITTDAMHVRTGTVIAEYSGSANFAASTHTSPQTVLRSFSKTLMSSSQKRSRVGQAVTFTVTVTSDGEGVGTPTGKVVLYLVRPGSSRLALGTAKLKDSVAAISVSTLPAGAQKIAAEYEGSENYRESHRSMTQTVINP